jgi:hypothetical protein
MWSDRGREKTESSEREMRGATRGARDSANRDTIGRGHRPFDVEALAIDPLQAFVEHLRPDEVVRGGIVRISNQHLRGGQVVVLCRISICLLANKNELLILGKC